MMIGWDNNSMAHRLGIGWIWYTDWIALPRETKAIVLR
jgi:hypothetical protein